jgi:hypothetical protein
MKLLFSFLLSVCLVQVCYADWPVKKKRWIMIPTYSYYHSNKYFDKQGKINPLSNGDHYVSHYFGLFTSYGLSDRLDLLVNIPIVNQRLTSSSVLSTKTGIGDMSIGLAYHFPSEDFKKYLTLKGALIIPAYHNFYSPYLGYAEKGIQLGLTYSITPNKQTYLTAEANYTRYLDQVNGPTQYYFAGTCGYSINPFEKLVFSVSHQLSKSSDNSFNPNLAVNKDFMLGKLSVSYGRRISRTVTPYAQFLFTPYGSNTGSSFSISLYAIIKIP